MFLSSACFKLWSRNTTEAQVDEAGEDISQFMSIFKQINDEPDCQKFNLHALLHLHEDRINFGPLSKVNAYAYENELQNFKNIFNSKNKRLESLVNKVKQQRMIPVEQKNDDKVHFISSCRSLQPETANFIKSYMRVDDQKWKSVKFFEGFSKNFLKITRFEYSKRKNNCDSFVKCSNGQFYNVKAIFSLSGGQYCLLEKIIVSILHPEINLFGHTTQIIHTFPISRMETEQFEVHPIDNIQKQLAFIDLGEKFRADFDYHQYLIECEN